MNFVSVKGQARSFERMPSDPKDSFGKEHFESQNEDTR
jgi:hypothetical protein